MSDTPVTPELLQYFYCAVCLEVQSELEAVGESVQLALTIVDGFAVCDNHRRRLDGYRGAVTGARRYLERQANPGGPPRGQYRR